MKKQLVTLGCFLLTLSTLSAQIPKMGGGQPQQQGGGNPMARFKIGRIYGKIVEKDTKQSVPFASVTVSMPMGKKDSLVGGGLTQENGDFNITELPIGRFKVKVTAMGFKEFTQTVTVMMPNDLEHDLGDIKLESDAKVLQAVDVTAQKSTMQMNIDRKVFNVDKNLSSVGGTAEDVLKNVPSVTISSEGGAQLRNNTAMVYVDGRPTFLSLNQISAEQIEQVEVISNPSAKFEAATQGGIINIVMKKNKKPGYNGFVSLAGGTNYTNNDWKGALVSTSIALNIKQGKWNISTFYNLNSNNSPNVGYADGTNLLQRFKFEQDFDNEFKRRFQVGRLGIDYSLNNRNTLTLASTIVRGNFDIYENQTFNWFDINTNALLVNGTRNQVAENQFKRNNVQFIWKKTYPKKGKELTADLLYDWGSSENVSSFVTRGTLAGTPLSATQTQRNLGGGIGNGMTFQLDYTNPLTDSSKLEMGLRSFMAPRTSYFWADTLKGDGTYARVNSLSADYAFEEFINAAYITYSNRWQGIGYQAGLRYEQSNFEGISNIAEQPKVGFDFPNFDKGGDFFKAFFPSLYLTKKFDAKNELQANFSRKINRPNFMQLMPVIMMADNQNVRIGNPGLAPEFINLAEINYNRLFGNNNLLTSLYLRNVENVITQFVEPYDALGRTKTTFINGAAAWFYGLDNTLKLQLSKSIEWTTNVNIFNISINAIDVQRQGWAYNLKSNLTWKLPKDWSIQAVTNYESEQVMPQGKRGAIYGTDLSFKKTFFRVASLTFSVNDVFDTRRFQQFYETNFLVQDWVRRREVRNFRIAFQMPFGKMDASIFKQRRRPQGQQGGQDEIF